MASPEQEGLAPASAVSRPAGAGGDDKTIMIPPDSEQRRQVPTAKDPPGREAGPADYFRVFRYANRWDFAAYAVGGLSSIAAGTTLPLMNVVLGQFIGHFNIAASEDLDEFTRVINMLGLYLLILFLARFVLNTLNKFAFRMIGIRISSAIRLHYLQSLFGQSIHVLDSMPPGAAATTITNTANVLQLGISEKLGTLLQWTSTIITALIIAFATSWRLTLVTFSVVVFLLLVTGVLAPLVVANYTKLTKADTQATAVASEAFSSIRMVMACGAEQRILRRFNPFVTKAKKYGDRTAPLLALQLGLIFFGLYASFGLAFWYGLRAYSQGLIGGVSQVIVCLMSIMMMVMSIQQVSTPLIAIGKAMVAAAEFYTVIDAPTPETGVLREPDVSAGHDIVFRNVTFAYPGRPHVKVLDRLDLTIEAGKITAIVGPSGSGKSTIVGLVERWYNLQRQHVIAKAVNTSAEKKAAKKAGKAGARSDKDDKPSSPPPPTLAAAGPVVDLEGSVETCGHSLDEIDLKWWRSEIGLVQQEPFLFNDTIYQNVAHGLVGSRWEGESEERKRELVRDACQEAFADEFIDRLPEGYNTFIGDGGARLSGGQRQRIAIARSIVRKPKILILDEATSAIDVRGERIVQAALDRASQSRTTITIAHRLSTIRRADRIVVLKRGRIVEQGTHESLLKNEDGVYSGLVYAQQLSLGHDDAPGVVQAEGGEKEREGEGGGESEGEGDMGSALSRKKSAAAASVSTAAGGQEDGPMQRGFTKSYGALLLEQRSQWARYLLTILFSAGAGANVPLMAYLFASITVVFQLTGAELQSQASFWACMWVALAAGLGVSYFAMTYTSSLAAQSISAAYKPLYLEAILFQKPAYFDREENGHGALVPRVVGDPKQLEELLGVPMAFVCQAGFGFVAGVSIAFAFAWKLALLGFFVTMPISLAASYYRVRYELAFEKMNTAVFEESSKFAAESIRAARTVSALTLEDQICGRYGRLLSGHVAEAYRQARWRSPVFAISDSISIACQALILWYGGRLLIRAELDVIGFLVCYMAVMQGAEAAGQGLSFGPNVAQVTAASNRIINARESRNRDEASAAAVPDTEGGVKLEIENVHFRYPARNVAVFRGLTITIERGQFAALVGPSGCGKTSIISLLERFYEPARGRILCNGLDIARLDVYAWRKHLSLVAQEATLLQGTIRENVLLGVDPAAVSDEQLHQVCRHASIHDFIASLPEGYDTDIGSRGVSLSGGQKQRLSIARALIRDPQVLLLDEATSSLDSESEKLVQAALERASKGRTTVVVAHRLATVQNADVIFVLAEGGRAVEQGSHGELLRRRGVYWRMCQSQALDR